MSLKHATGGTPPYSSNKRARFQLFAVRRALDYNTTNKCRTMIVYEGAGNIQMKQSALMRDTIFRFMRLACHLACHLTCHLACHLTCHLGR
jgi:hypothetical protein